MHKKKSVDERVRDVEKYILSVWQLTDMQESGSNLINPECLAGLCGRLDELVHPEPLHIDRLPSQGPAPLSTWGFSLADRFVVGLAGANQWGSASKRVAPWAQAERGRRGTTVREVLQCAGFDSRGLHHKAITLTALRASAVLLNGRLGRKHPACGNARAPEATRRSRGPSSQEGTMRKSVMFGAVGAYRSGVHGPLKSPASDVGCFWYQGGSTEGRTSGGITQPLLWQTYGVHKNEVRG
jgi:hypothetical protein